MKVTATTNLKAFGEKLREKPKVTAVVGVVNTGSGNPSLTQIMEWLNFGWVQAVTPKQSAYFHLNHGINLKVGNSLVLPPRPFFTGVFYEKREALLEHLKTYLKQGISPRDAVLRVAREMQDAAQAAIAQGHTETMDFARLAPMTMELKAQKAATDLDKKGRKKRRDSTGFALSDRPFASDGARQMRDAIKYELKE